MHSFLLFKLFEILNWCVSMSKKNVNQKNVNQKNVNLDKLATLSRRAATLEGISQLLSWDQETYMPESASSARAEQRKLLAELSHAIKTGPEFETALKALCDLK